MYSTARSAGQEIVVLDLARVEVANVIWKRQRRGLTLMPEAESALQRLRSFPLKQEVSEPLLNSAFLIAVQYDRSIYDALFLALAQKMNERAVTADAPMYNAVRQDFPKLELLRNL